MKLRTKAILVLVCLHTVSIGSSQVTKLSNNSNLETGIPLGNIAVLISENDSLWRTDGTSIGTFKYATNVSADSPYTFAILSNKIYFTGVNAANGKELWVTDGTAGGTSLVKDISPGVANSTPTNLMVFNNALYFFANTAAEGTEIWKSDGTQAGTVLLKDIKAGVGSSIGLTGTMFPNTNYLYFQADDGTTGTELWRTDGTPAGTILLKDINPGSASSNPSGLTAFGLTVVFNATDAANGAELWKSDGTLAAAPAGTILVKDVAAGPFGSNPLMFLLFNSKIYFDALDFTNGLEPWVTDGTNANTSLLKDIDPGFSFGFPLLFDAAFMNNKFYFPATTTSNGDEIWFSDGTTLNTLQFSDINPGAGSSSPFFLLDYLNGGSVTGIHSKLFNGKMFFYANNGTNGNELWITNGTVPGTMMVKDINPGADSSVNDSLIHFYTTNALYFDATDGTTGYELWKSDGTPGNTNRVFDINPGNAGSYPKFVSIFNGIVLFTAHDGDNAIGSRDLFRLDGNFAPLPLGSLALTASVFDRSVRLKWVTISEENTSHFVIERSKDGSFFEMAGSVNATGNSSLKKDYVYNDVDAFMSGVNKLYYRLKVIDRDGKFKYSEVITLHIDRDSKLLSSYPNPVNEVLNVIVNSGVHKQIALEITDESGKQFYRQLLNNVTGQTSYNLNLSSFARGLYFIRLQTDAGIKAVKLIKD